MDDLVYKDTPRTAVPDDPSEFIMSDATVDRMGDSISQDGWDLTNFQKNPIALFGHNSALPIGRWRNAKVKDGALRGKLELLEQGKSPRVDEIRAFIEAGMLRSVSVGFKPSKEEPLDPRDPYGPKRYLQQELVECSLVSIPANPNALAIAKELNLSDDARSLIFGEPARGTMQRRDIGEIASPVKIAKQKGPSMSTLAEKIRAAEATVLGLKDQLTEHVNKAGDELDDSAIAVSDELSARIEGANKSLAALRKAEEQLGIGSAPVSTTPVLATSGGMEVSGRVYASPMGKKPTPGDLLVRAIACKLLSKVTGNSPEAILMQRYGNDHERETRTLVDYVAKTATVPATTTLNNWALQLVATGITEFLDTLTPDSIYPKLAAQGSKFTFGRNGIISIPSRVATPNIAGSFIAEGAPIPVKQGAFTAITITPRKMAVISTFTREIAEHSTPAIEGLIRTIILQDTAVAIDTVLMDATASSTTRPAGLKNGAATQAGTAGANIAALIADLKYMVGVLAAANSLRNPVWIMNPVNALSASLLQNSGGDLMFANDINNGRLLGYPIILSTTNTAGTVMLIDAADFFTATGDEPRFDISDTATIHMEDTTPLAIGTTGSPNVVAAPVRSLWQTDTLGMRMIADVNWAMRRTGVIAYVTAVTW